MEHINIGLDTSFLSHLVVDDLKEALSEIEISYDLVNITSCNLDSLASEKVDAIVLPINQIPFSQVDDPWVIAGFIRRQACRYYCYLETVSKDIFGVKPNGKVVISDPELRLQINNLRPDIIVTEEDQTLALSQIKNRTVDAYITNRDLTESSLQKVPLALGDIVPHVGIGIYAMVCDRLDIKTRKLVQRIHHDDTGYLSNVERELSLKISKRQKELPSIHCNQNRAGHYILQIFNPKNGQNPQRVQISQSTFVGLVDRALNEL